jgi:anti-sigma B factor antagonist
MSDQYNPQFEVSVERAGTTAIVRLAGELDLATAPELAEVLHGLEPECQRIILDVTGLEFIDSTGLRLAVVEHDRAALDGFEFVIAGAAGSVLKVL